MSYALNTAMLTCCGAFCSMAKHRHCSTRVLLTGFTLCRGAGAGSAPASIQVEHWKASHTIAAICRCTVQCLAVHLCQAAMKTKLMQSTVVSPDAQHLSQSAAACVSGKHTACVPVRQHAACLACTQCNMVQLEASQTQARPFSLPLHYKTCAAADILAHAC
jgi:hypothetical protein